MLFILLNVCLLKVDFLETVSCTHSDGYFILKKEFDHSITIFTAHLIKILFQLHFCIYILKWRIFKKYLV